MVYLFLIFLALCALSAWFYVICPKQEIVRRRKIIEKMTVLRDDVRNHSNDTNALDSLINSLRSEDSFEKTRAAVYLGDLNKLAEPAVHPLMDVLEGSDLFAAREAAASLGEIGPGATDAIPSLIMAVQRYSQSDIGAFAARSLGKIADPEDLKTRTVLKQAGESPYNLLKNNAILALEELERRNKAP